MAAQMDAIIYSSILFICACYKCVQKRLLFCNCWKLKILMSKIRFECLCLDWTADTWELWTISKWSVKMKKKRIALQFTGTCQNGIFNTLTMLPIKNKWTCKSMQKIDESEQYRTLRSAVKSIVSLYFFVAIILRAYCHKITVKKQFSNSASEINQQRGIR